MHSAPRRILLGLPARLAFLMVGVIAICAAGIFLFSARQLEQSASDRATAVASASMEELVSQLSEADFVADADAAADARTEKIAPEDPRMQQPVGERLDLLVQADDSRHGAVLFNRPTDSTVEGVHVSSDISEGEMRALAQAAFESGDEQTELVVAGDDRVNLAWPVPFADGRVGGVVAASFDAGAVLADAASVRRQLLLGTCIGALLLSIAILLLLRRELFRPLDELRRVMAQIRGGAQGVRIGWTRRDELGLVASEFDSMVTQLELVQAELARFVNRDPLTGLLTGAAFTDRLAGELTRARREGYPISLLAIDIDDLDEINRTHDRAAGDHVLAGIGEVIGGSIRPTDAAGRTGDDSFHVALIGADAAQAAIVIRRIRAVLAEQVGVGPEQTRVTCGFGVAEYPTHSVDQIALERMAVAACTHAQRAGRDGAVAFGPAGGYVDVDTLVSAAERAEDVPAGERELASTVHALARSLDGIDPVLGGGAHSQRVARYAIAVARELGMSDGELRELRSAAVLHDIGKVAVPPAILRMREDELDERQRGALRYHAWVARTMIAGAGLRRAAATVFHMPERWDGTGYPERRREDAIPVASRVLHAAELLDTLTSPGIDGTAMSPMRAASELKRRAGSELDPDIAVRLARLVRDDGLCGDVEGELTDAA